ncbi:BPSS1780 family membrane protein [Methyloversatilis sp.]|uniref:BPSS1780 family membrane protein n=1 Tax=Methyloversatilis sp. TaxID=2569862 RepID=UPI0035AE2970
MSTDDRNPFESAPPPGGDTSASLRAGEPDSRSVSAGQGLEWLRQGWQAFVAAPGEWVLITLLWVVAVVVLNLVPLFGMIAATLLAVVTVGGLMGGCRALSRGEPFGVAHLWAGFGERVNPLLALGGWYLLASLAIGMLILLLLVISAGLAGIAAMAGLAALMAAVPAMLIVAVMLMAPVLMAVWFAPALVMFHDMTALDAMRVSFFASLRNAPAFVVFALLYVVLTMLASVPAMLGWLVLLPVTFGAMYASYRDVFDQP